VGNGSNLTSNKNINVINYKSINYQVSKGNKYKSAETDSQNQNHSSTNRNIELTTVPNKPVHNSKRISLVSTNLIEIMKKRKATEN
jgi:hypothetical protein